MLLSDTTILKLCVPPKRAVFTVTNNQYEFHSYLHKEHLSAEEKLFISKGTHMAVIVESITAEDLADGSKELNGLMHEIPKWEPMITPFVPELIRTTADGSPCLSYGLTSVGYDVRCGTKFALPVKRLSGEVLDSRKPADGFFTEIDIGEDGYIDIPAKTFFMCHTLEYFVMPRDVAALVLGKSTLARMGVVPVSTPIEPGFSGNVTLEFVNSNDHPVRIYAGDAMGQFWFSETTEPVTISYADRGGKYNGQNSGITYHRP
jgi:dCTP deaminase